MSYKIQMTLIKQYQIFSIAVSNISSILLEFNKSIRRKVFVTKISSPQLNYFQRISTKLK